jgi:adenylosuccinate synthase
MVMRWHRALDAAAEARREEGKKIGTTGRGIGPAYGAKVGRSGMRAGDLLKPNFLDLVREQTEEANDILRSWGAPALDVDEMVELYRPLAKTLAPYVTDTVALVNAAAAAGKSILLEGAQGTMLDIDFGTYPFVTSSNCTAGGACTGSGLSPRRIDCCVGVLKCYTTRVGEGPFPTELDDEDGETLRQRGHEFGATTGRKRRCGWFDAVIARYAAAINGFDFWAMTKLDVLDTFKTIKICVAYERDDGKRYDTFPSDLDELARCKPVYEEMPGWQCATSSITSYDQLPDNARAYVERLVELTGVQIGILSIGPARASTVRMGL